MDLTEIRTGLAAHGTPTRGHRYPPELRAGIRAHICTAHASGQSWASLGRELGLQTVTLQRRAEPQATRADTALRIRTASGAILEGGGYSLRASK